MGFAICRFSQDEGCNERGSQHWIVSLPDQNYVINVPSMWKHYMTEHLVQPTDEERRVILAADPAQATGNYVNTRSSVQPNSLQVMYIDRLGPHQYSHKIGDSVDTGFIGKLESILDSIEPFQTKGIPSGYR